MKLCNDGSLKVEKLPIILNFESPGKIVSSMCKCIAILY